jgi:hypothetical protein
MRCASVVMMFLVVCASDTGSAADLRIDRPENDKLLLAPLVDVVGTATTPQGAIVTVTANGVAVTTTVTDGRWSAKGLSLNIGANLIDVQIEHETKSVLIVRGADGDVQKLPPRKVRFWWNDGVDDELKSLVRGSLDATLTMEELESFVQKSQS